MSIYSKVPVSVPRKSLFDLSYSKVGTGEIGRCYPVLCEEVVSGDVWKVSTDVVVKLMPLVRPLMTDLSVQLNHFFVPYRLLDDKFEDIFTGGEDGSANFNALPKISPKYYKHNVANSTPYSTSNYSDNVAYSASSPGAFGLHGLWDCLGFPTVTSSNSTGASWLTTSYDSNNDKTVENTFYTSPIAYPIMAYYTIFNEWYRDENNDDYKYEYELKDYSGGFRFLEDVQRVEPDGSSMTNGYTQLPLFSIRWSKDYFTSALPFAQRGTAPALPISGMLPVGLADNYTLMDNSWIDMGSNEVTVPTNLTTEMQYANDTFSKLNLCGGPATQEIGVNNAVVADLSSAVTFDINDLRLAFSIQKWQERNAISGGRFHEVLLSHFGTAPADDTLDRPLYLGGSYQDLIISSVVQTSESGTTVQGNETGRGISASKNYGFKYHVKEPGIVMTLMCVKPKAQYSSQGFNRQWLKNNRYDFFFPEFSNIGEQEVLNMELFANGTVADDTGIFGFQGRYDELRSKQNMQVGLMRGDSDYNTWSASRCFSSLPTLSSAFLEVPSTFCDNNKAVTSEPLFQFEVHNNIKALRPLPKYPTPGGL